MRTMVTRPAEDAERIAGPLRQRGVDVVIEPLLVVSPAAAADVDLSDVAAFLLTSANGVRVLSQTLGDDPWARRLPAFCVGDQTARVAEELDFTRVFSAKGDVTSLAALVTKSFRKDAGTLLHVAGSKVAGDLKGALEAEGFTVRRKVLYETRPAIAFSSESRRMLAEGAIQAVFLYSPRTAATFTTLAKKADLGDALRSLSVYCLSQAVADQLTDLPLNAVRVAAEPTQDALLAIFDDDNASHFQWREQTGSDDKGEQAMTERPKDDDGKTPAAPSSGDAKPASQPQPSKDTKPETKSVPPKPDAKPEAKPARKVEAKADAKKDTVPPVTAKSSAPQDQSGGGGGGLLIAFLTLLVVVLGLWIAMPLWHGLMPASMQPMVTSFMPGAGTTAQVQTLSQEADDLRQALSSAKTTLSGLERRVAALESRPVTTGEATVPPELTNRLGALEQAMAAQPSGLADRVSDLQGKVDQLAGTAAQASSVLALSDKVSALDEQVRRATSRQDKALAFLLAVGQLRQAADTGRPFDDELRVAKAVAPADFDMDATLAGFAERAAMGAPTMVALRQRFASLSSDVVRASMRAAGDASWWDRTVDRLTSVVTVTRTDGAAVGESSSAIVARAELLLEAGDLAAAVAELDGLSGGAANVAAGWIVDAKARLAADKGLSVLTSEALARVAAGANAPSGKEG